MKIAHLHSQPGDLIIEEGSIGDGMFLIVKGTVQVSKKLSGGEEMRSFARRLTETPIYSSFLS